MEQAQIKKLLDKVSMLEAKASILLDESSEIKKMLEDIVDPDNKKAQAYFERQKKKAERDVTVRALSQRINDKRIKKLQAAQQLNSHGSKYRAVIE